MMEVGVVVSLDGEPLHWHLPPGRSGASLPDARDLWDVLWEHREHLAGVAHSHPGSGRPGPSREDVTTFAAIEAALGRRLSWWITSQDRVIELRWVGPEKHKYGWREVQADQEPCRWINELRRLSYEAPAGGR
jgi:hypothetical protein